MSLVGGGGKYNNFGEAMQHLDEHTKLLDEYAAIHMSKNSEFTHHVNELRDTCVELVNSFFDEKWWQDEHGIHNMRNADYTPEAWEPIKISESHLTEARQQNEIEFQQAMSVMLAHLDDVQTNPATILSSGKLAKAIVAIGRFMDDQCTAVLPPDFYRRIYLAEKQFSEAFDAFIKEANAKEGRGGCLPTWLARYFKGENSGGRNL